MLIQIKYFLKVLITLPAKLLAFELLFNYMFFNIEVSDIVILLKFLKNLP